jgi:hypothetical protein
MQDLNSKIYIALINPPGEPDDKITSYYTQSQLEQQANFMMYQPVHIMHQTTNANGEPLPPAGFVISSMIHPKTGALYGAFILNDNETGKIAKTLLGEDGLLPPEAQMKEVSLGYEFLNDSNGLPIANRATEVSIVYKGAREGTEIKRVTNFKEVIEKVKNKEKNKLNFSSKLNHKDNHPPPTYNNVKDLNKKQKYSKTDEYNNVTSIKKILNKINANNNKP